MDRTVLSPSVASHFIEKKIYNPHHYLGLHVDITGNHKVIRLYRPGAHIIYLEVEGRIVEAKKIDDAGFFEYPVGNHFSHLSYKIYHASGLLAHDPYAFWPTLGELDLYFLGKGVHYELYEKLGAKKIFHLGVWGVRFALWAPKATVVNLIADFNHFDTRVNPMRALGSSGVWELFVPGIELGEKYKFEIVTSENRSYIKADPFANFSELRPSTASIVTDLNQFAWSDGDYLSKRKTRSPDAYPMLVYELHLGSWKKKHGSFLNYKDLAFELGAYVKEMGFTHVELLPIMEHPLDESWGYQVSGFFSVTSRFGTPEEFQFFVNHLHSLDIGVILDWVPAHFPQDEFALSRFDGTALYEHEDPRKGYHPHWHTLIFNYGRFEVVNFLIASALFWMDKMHIDGLRVDAVASMLYLDYGRNEGEWIANHFGGKENVEAIQFIKHLNSIVHQYFPDVLMIAEESTSFMGVTHKLEHLGLGFDLKWNMGWMNDTLSYFHKDPFFRAHHHNHLTFGILYAFSERFALVLSHDEVVHGKGSIISKMPGDYWQKFANVRLLYSYMIAQPGKKLIFMGMEIGQWNEWNCKGELEWFLLQFPIHKGLQNMIKDLNKLYLNNSCFWAKDFSHEGFEWIDFLDHQNSVISYLRKTDTTKVLCIHNFTPAFFERYFVHITSVKKIEEIFNSDHESYGGSGKCNQEIEIYPHGLNLTLSPLSTQIFEIEFYE